MPSSRFWNRGRLHLFFVLHCTCEIFIMPKFENQTLELALFALVALAMLVQAIVLLAAFIAIRKAALSMDQKLAATGSSADVPDRQYPRACCRALTPQDRRNRRRSHCARSLILLAGTDADMQFAANGVVGSRAHIRGHHLDGMVSTCFRHSTAAHRQLRKKGDTVRQATCASSRQYGFLSKRLSSRCAPARPRLARRPIQRPAAITTCSSRVSARRQTIQPPPTTSSPS